MPSSPLGFVTIGTLGAAAAVLFWLSEQPLPEGFSLFSEDALAGVCSFAAAQVIPPAQLRQLKQAVRNLSQALEQFEQALGGEQPTREEEEERAAAAPNDKELLSILEVCQKLGMSKSWVYRRIRTKEIPSIKLGHNIKVRRQDLEEYLGKVPSYQPPEE